MARIVLDHVRKVYPNGHEAVRDASFAVADGEFVVFVGPSGCGKSTMLRMIAGLEDATAGTLSIGGRVVADPARGVALPPKDRDVAMVFQNYALYPHMSVRDNMAFGLKVRRFPKAEIDERVGEAARILGLEPELERKPGQLSGGQRQRVAVGRAIVRKPAVFLFDEPLSNLDAKLRVQMRTEISKLHRQLRATMVYVTHDQVEAMTMGDRIVVLKGGEIQQVDTPLGLYGRPVNRFVAGFIGSPAMNFVEGRLSDDGRRFIAEGGADTRADTRAEGGADGGAEGSPDGPAFTLPLQEGDAERLRGHRGRAVTLGVRPEDLYLPGSAALAGPSATAAWTLDVVEPMGNEIVIYVHAGSGPRPHEAVARVAPQPLPEPGQRIELAIDLTKLHFFDPATEEALTETAPTEAVAEEV